MPATKIVVLGKDSVTCARAMVTVPSSSGWRNCSRTFLGNSGNSSRNKTPLMRQAHFARPRRTRSSADQPGVGNRMVRRSERPRLHQPHALRQDPGDAVDLRGFERLGESQRRKDSGESFGQHGLSRARRSDQQAHCGFRPRPLPERAWRVSCPRTSLKSRKSSVSTGGATALRRLRLELGRFAQKTRPLHTDGECRTRRRHRRRRLPRHYRLGPIGS